MFGTEAKDVNKPEIIFPPKTVYLAGTISGLDYGKATFGWRSDFADCLRDHGFHHIHCKSPMRGKEILSDFGVLSSGGDYPDDPMTRSQGIVCRDRNDVRTADLMVAGFWDNPKGNVSRGTFVEFGWADAFRTPVIVGGAPDDPNVNYPAMMPHLAGYVVETIEEAAIITGRLLTPGIA